MKQEWPNTRRSLESKGWTFQRRGFCSGQQCKKTIEWWKSPSGRNVVLEQTFRTDPNQLVDHNLFCKNAKDFQQKPVAEKPIKEKAVAVGPKKVSRELERDRLPSQGTLWKSL